MTWIFTGPDKSVLWRRLPNGQEESIAADSERGMEIAKTVTDYIRPDYSERRRAEYEKRGLSIERLVIALIENDANELQTIHELRAEVKRAIQKEEIS